MHNYSIVESVGKGAYAKVYKAVNPQNPTEIVALKQINIASKDSANGLPQYVLREIAMLKKLNLLGHSNVVKLFDVVVDTRADSLYTSVTLVFEFLPRSLLQYLEYYPKITPEICRSLLYQTLQGIDFLHVNGVIHRDIKPENLLLTNEGVVKIADFGLSKSADVGTYLTTVTVTLWYRPLEVLLGCDYNTSADIWSLGIVMCQLFRRIPLIQTSTEIDTLKKIIAYLGLPEAALWPKTCALSREQFTSLPRKNFKHEMRILCSHGWQLLRSMLDYDIDRRCTAAEALLMPYFMPNQCSCPFQIAFPLPLMMKG